MAPKLLEFVQKLFRSKWKRQIEYDGAARRRRPACVLKSVSSKSSLSIGSVSSSLTRHNADSIDSINFEFRSAEDSLDLCCVRKCCEKCFCEEGEAMAQGVRKSRRIKRRTKISQTFFRCRNPREISKSETCICTLRSRSSTPPRSIDSACDVSSTSSCQELKCRYRDGYSSGATSGIPVQTFANIHASAVASDSLYYNSLTPPYENVVNNGETGNKASQEPVYDSIPTRTPRAVTEPNYENVLSINCIDNCVFRQISSLLDATQNPSQMVESIQHLHKGYSCVRRSSSADNEINYFYENYEDYENDFNMELERRLSD